MVPVCHANEALPLELYETLKHDGHSELWAFRTDEGSLGGATPEKIYRSPKAEQFSAKVRDASEDKLATLAASLARDFFADDPESLDDLADMAAELADEAALRVGDSALLNSILEARRTQDSRRHAVLVGSLATMFATAGGDWHLAADLVVAATFHDLGLAFVPRYVARKPAALRSPKERALFEDHVVQGLSALGAAEEPLSTEALRMIQEHHERADGTGFPNALHGPQLFRGTQYLALANAFEDLWPWLHGPARRSPPAKHLKSFSAPAQPARKSRARSVLPCFLKLKQLPQSATGDPHRALRPLRG